MIFMLAGAAHAASSAQRLYNTSAAQNGITQDTNDADESGGDSDDCGQLGEKTELDADESLGAKSNDDSRSNEAGGADSDCDRASAATKSSATQLPRSSANKNCGGLANDSQEQSADVDNQDSPTLLTQFDYYSDSDHYLNLTTTSLATAPFHGLTVSLRRDWLQDQDRAGPEAAEITVLAFTKEFSELWGVGGGFGTARGLVGNDLVGSIRAHLDLAGMTLTGTIARDLLAESAQALRANIRRTDFGLSFSDELSEHLSVDLELHHRMISDTNASDEVEFSPQYALDLAAGKLTLGYRFNYNSFARNTDNGYWAPQQAVTNQLVSSWAFDWTSTFGRAELGLGYDSVRQIGTLSDGPSGGGVDLSAAVAVGIRPVTGTELQLYLTNDRSAGWSSNAAGISLKYTF